MHSAIIGRGREVVGAEVDVILNSGVVIGENRLNVKYRQQMQVKGFGDIELIVLCPVFPLLVVVERIVGITAITAGPIFARHKVGGPVKPPKQVACLHEQIIASVAAVVVAFSGRATGADVGRQLEEFASLGCQVDASAEAVKIVDADTALIAGVCKRGVVVNIRSCTAHSEVIVLEGGSSEIGFVPVEVFPGSTRVVVVADDNRRIQANSLGGEGIAMLVEPAVELPQGIRISSFIAAASRGFIIMEYFVKHFHLLLSLGGLIVFSCPRWRETHRYIQINMGLALGAFLCCDEDNTISSA